LIDVRLICHIVIFRTLLLLLPCFNAMSQFGQEQPPSQLQLNIDKLQTTISLDRSVYAPKEVAMITVSFHNPTSATLDVVAPFSASEGFDLFEKDSDYAKRLGIEYPPMSPHPYSAHRPWSDAPSLHLAPGETFSKTIRSDLRTASELLVFPKGTVPPKPGRYRISYSYDPRAQVEFNVFEPTFERFVTLALAKERVEWRNSERDSGMREITHYVHVFVLADGNRRFIFRTLRSISPREKPTTLLGKILTAGDVQSFSLERVAEVDGPVTGVEIDPPSGGSIAIHWADRFGKWQEMRVPDEAKWAH
jgi:hypothetical protein